MNLTTGLISFGGLILGAVGLGLMEALRHYVDQWMARSAVIGAVQRAAGLALEMERAGGVQPALDAALDYVETAVPDALKKVGASPHLQQMILGAVGVLRTQKVTVLGTNPSR